MPKDSRFRLSCLLLIAALTPCVTSAQEAPAATPKQPLEHAIGAVTAVDKSAHTVTMKEDQTGAERVVLLANTRTLLKVEPGAKDLKSASRITADDLEVGDRIDVRGLKAEDNPAALAARSVVLMSARDLQQAHQAQAAAWQHSTAGIVTSVDQANGKINVTARTPDGPKPLAIVAGKGTEFTRYSPENPKVPAPSQLVQIQTGDQVRVIGDKSDDGTTITAQRVYSGAFRTISATVSSVAPDGKSVTVKDLATKKPVEIALNDESAVRKLPPQMAMMLARRFNPSYKPPDGAPTSGAPAGNRAAPESSDGTRPADSAPASGQGNPAWQRGGAGAQGGGQGGSGGMRSGDISQMLERLPKTNLADLKPGDAVVISGVATGADNSRLLATNIIAGVEPILQSAPQRQGQAGGDWGLGEMAVPQ